MTGTGIMEVVSLLHKICESVEKVLPPEDSIVLSKTRNIIFDRLNARQHNGDRFALKQLNPEVAVLQHNAKEEEGPTQRENAEVLLIRKERDVLQKELQALRESSNASIQGAEPMTLVLQQVVADLEKQVGKPSTDLLQNPDYCATFNENSKTALVSMLLECSRSLDAEKSIADSLRDQLEEQNTLRNLAIECQAREAAARQEALNTRQQQEELEIAVDTQKRIQLQLEEALKAKENDQALAQLEISEAGKQCEELKESVNSKCAEQVSSNKAAGDARKQCEALKVQVAEYQQMELYLQQALEAKGNLVSEQKCAADNARKRCEELEALVAEQRRKNSELEEELKMKSSADIIQQQSQEMTAASFVEHGYLESHLHPAELKAEEDGYLLSAENLASALSIRCEELEALLSEHQGMESQFQERLEVEVEEKKTAQSEAVVLTQKCEELEKLIATHEETELERKKMLKARDEDVRSRIREEVDSNAEQLNLIIVKLKDELSDAKRSLNISEVENVALVNGESIARSAVNIQPTDRDTKYPDHISRRGIRDNNESCETDGEIGSALSPDVALDGMFEEYEPTSTISTKPDNAKLDIYISKPDTMSIHNRVDSVHEDDASTEQPTVPVASHALYSDKWYSSSEEHLFRASNHLMTSSPWSPMPTAGINRKLEDDTLLVLETGDWQVRMGLIDIKGGHSYYDEFPCCLARPRRNAGEASDLVSMASGVSAKMYSLFRSEGVFVGADAWFCCMDHPDAGLRTKLELSSPLERGHIVQDRMDDLQRLWAAAFKNAKVESSLTPTIVAFKPNATTEEVRSMVSVMLDRFKVPAVRMVNEASVVALAGGITTGIVVSLGHTSTFVCPIFEGCAISNAIRVENVGGKDIDRFLDYMLLSRTNEDYNQMVERRRLDYARDIKEQHCYVAKNFAVEAGTAGHFQRKSMKVFEGAGEADEKLSKYGTITTSEFYDQQNEDDPVEVSFTQKNGKELLLKVGRERFHAPEILFNPSIWEDSENSVSLNALIVDAVMACHADIRLPLLQNVVLTGNTSKIPGLEQRLQMELELELSEHLCDEPVVRTIDDESLYPASLMSRATPSAVIKGSELLFRNESDCHDCWILQSDYVKDPSVIHRHYYFCSD